MKAGAEYRLTVIRGFGRERVHAESMLRDRGIVLPVTQRVELAGSLGYSDAFLLVACDRNRRYVAAVPIALGVSRVLPGYHRSRVSRLTAGVDPDLDMMLIWGIADLARRDPRCLRMTVQLFGRKEEQRGRLARTLQLRGFVRADQTQSYANTLGITLDVSEDRLHSDLPGDTRRNIRAPLKRGLEVRRVDDVVFAPRLSALTDEVFRRTSARSPTFPWAAIIALAAREPSSSTVVGVFDPSVPGPESLLSFAWGVMYRGHAAYEVGAATRFHSHGNISLGAAPLWNLVLWARRNSAPWFDLGGITDGSSQGTEDPVRGISAFKRSFSSNVLSVSEEWVMKPHRVRSAIADTIATVARRFRLLTKT